MRKIVSTCTILGGHWPPHVYLVKNTVVQAYMNVPADGMPASSFCIYTEPDTEG